MEPKGYVLVLAAGVVVTLLLGLWNAVVNYRNSRRTNFVNIVTSQRIKWIEQLRQDIGSYCGLTYHWSHSEMEGKSGEADMVKELDRLRHVIRLRLNPHGEPDRIIENLIEEIPKYTDRRDSQIHRPKPAEGTGGCPRTNDAHHSSSTQGGVGQGETRVRTRPTQ